MTEIHIVHNFAAAEGLIARGVDSAQVGVDLHGDPEGWIEARDRALRGGALVPPEPLRFPFRILVVLPTFNERENLADLVTAIHRYLECDVLVVDDGSPDGTGAIARGLAERDPRVHLLDRPGKRGLGRASAAGFRWALERSYDRICEMDCGFSHAPWDLPRLAAASADHDLVIGSRYVPRGGSNGWSLRRRTLSRGANLYARLFLGGAVRDWTAGFRCYRTALLQGLDLEGLAARGYAFQIEIAWRAIERGARVAELPIRFTERTRGASKMDRSIVLEAMRLVPRLRWRQ